MINKWFWVVIVVALRLNSGYSQTINSPYSNIGLGEVLFQGLPHNFAMGELGIGTYSNWHINIQNPAMLINNTFSSFQVGIAGDVRNHETNLAATTDNSAGLRFMALSFPVIKNRWVTSIAALPLSSVKYNTFASDTLATGAFSTTSFQGDGGLSQAIWTNSIRLYKTLSLGIKASYIFGKIDRSSRIALFSEDFSSTYVVSLIESQSYNDFNFQLGLAYKITVGEKKVLNLGSTYNFASSLSGNLDQFFLRQRLSGDAVQTQNLIEDQQINFELPPSFAFGTSFEKLNAFKFGVDIVLQNWSNSQQENAETAFRNTANISVGGEWIPDIQNVSNYFKRVTYRVGIVNKQLPYLVNATEINDFGINFGASFPVSGYSSMDIGFKYGVRGTLDNELIRENYFQIVLGATINDRWFIKRRYD